MCLKSDGIFTLLVSTTTFYTSVWLRGAGKISVGLSKFSNLLMFLWLSILSAILSTRMTEPDSIIFFGFFTKRPFLDQIVPMRVY